MLIMETLSQIAHKYTTFLVDITGVLSDGKQYNPQAIQALISYKILGKKIVLLNNYPRDSHSLIQETHINEECYTHIWTSGEYMKHTLCKQSKPLKFFFINSHTHLWCNSSSKDSCTQVDNVSECDFIVIEDFPVAGMYTNHQLIEEYASSLKYYEKPIICLSREKQDIYGSHITYQIGELGELCEKIGIKVTYIGKGDKSFYKSCFTHCSIDPTSDSILLIGDNLLTDIATAQNFVQMYESINNTTLNLHTALITSGIYHNSDKALHEINLHNIKPTYLSHSL